MHSISVECEQVPGGTTCYGEQISVPSDVTLTFTKAKAAYDLNGHSFTFGPGISINIPSPNSRNPDGSYHDDEFINTYDTLILDPADFAVSKCLSDFLCAYSFTSGSPALQAALIYFMRNLKTAPIDFLGLVVSMVITFHDGSTETYNYDGLAKAWKKVAGTGRDSHQNGPGYDGGNLGHLVNTLVSTDPHCVALDWDGQHLTCVLSP
jgi:hypothetical protein